MRIMVEIPLHMAAHVHPATRPPINLSGNIQIQGVRICSVKGVWQTFVVVMKP